MHDRTEVVMGTFVTMRVVRGDEDEVRAATDRAFGWFFEIEDRCSRFDTDSELMRLCASVNIAVPVSPMLYQAVKFALAVAAETNGAFDPTVGRRMAARGFDREHRSGRTVPAATASGATYRDVQLDAKRRTITLRKPLTLDLGAVAKGLAIDTAVRELAPFRDFAIDAGGDLFLSGMNQDGEPWSVGIRHPRRSEEVIETLRDNEIIETLRVSGKAVCTSGGYERRVAGTAHEHHILDPRTGASPAEVASATVVAPNAMIADALATAAFVSGSKEGIALLERMGVEGLIFTRGLNGTLDRATTRGLRNVA